ncbi:MAG TPA: hypothetical protein VGN35_09500 [Jatrophihabitantaceae bacterium]|nr:hypothetical protein [Jatrophihabitantaceae bacterium]
MPPEGSRCEQREPDQREQPHAQSERLREPRHDDGPDDLTNRGGGEHLAQRALRIARAAGNVQSRREREGAADSDADDREPDASKRRAPRDEQKRQAHERERQCSGKQTLCAHLAREAAGKDTADEVGEIHHAHHRGSSLP